MSEDDVRWRDTEQASRFVANSLAARAQSVAEIEVKLARRGVSEAAARAAIDDALRLGYLNDAELAGQVARGTRSRGYGRRRAAAALRRRGLSPADAEVALDDAYGEEDELELALAALGSRAIVDDEAGRRRVVGFLVRRGFPTGVAWQAVREALDARRPDAGP